MLGQPMFLPPPVVVGVRVVGALAGRNDGDRPRPDAHADAREPTAWSARSSSSSATGCSTLELADRATLSNMCPEYGATSAYLPVDDETLRYLAFTGRERPGRPRRALHEGAGAVPRRRRPRAGLQRGPRARPLRGRALGRRTEAAAGPGRRSPRCGARSSRRSATGSSPTRGRPRSAGYVDEGGNVRGRVDLDGPSTGSDEPVRRPTREVRHGSVVIAAITSCTNTSNPARDARGRPARQEGGRGGPGDQAVGEDVARTGFARRDRLPRRGRAHAVPRQARLLARRVRLHDVHRELRAAARGGGGRRRARTTSPWSAVLSGNRNFEGRIHPLVRASYLASPPLVRRVRARGPRRDRPVDASPLGTSADGTPVYLTRPVADARGGPRRRSRRRSHPNSSSASTGAIFDGDERWRALPTPEGPVYAWDPDSTYVREPPFFEDLEPTPAEPSDIAGARVPRQGRGLDHDRPHLAGGLDQAGLARRAVPARPRRRAARLQLATARGAATTR